MNQRCEACGAENPDTFKFCPQCGTPVAAKPAGTESLPTSSEEQLPDHADRRLVTIVFCDLIDSTELSDLLDPEDYRDILRGYQQACARILESYEGHVAQYLGDGILAYLGYPKAKEDDAIRAVNAGLSIVSDAPRELMERFSETTDHDLAIRVGIHTGSVITGEVGGGATREHLALGSAPNIAARLQGVAGKNQAVISAATRELVERDFQFEDLGLKSLKGISKPQQVYRVTGRQRKDRLVPIGKTETPVSQGRTVELKQLLTRWRQVCQEDGQLFYVCGEPGMGKSSLLDAFINATRPEVGTVFFLQGSPYHSGSAFHPLIDMLQAALSLGPEVPAEQRARHVTNKLGKTAPDLLLNADIILDFLSLPPTDPEQLGRMSAEEKRFRLKATCIELVRQAASQQPSQVIVDDAHFLDPSTQEWLLDVADQIGDVPVLLLVSSRPVDSSPWQNYSGSLQHHELNLARLSDEGIESIIRNLTAGKSLPRTLKDHLVEQTGGNPLFLEQLLRSLLESDWLVEKSTAFELSGPFDTEQIPTTLQASLMARLDTLGVAKSLAGLAATAGPRFSRENLRVASGLDDVEFGSRFNTLIEAGIIEPLEVQELDHHVFHHGLIREAAYQSLLRRTRREYHKRFAELLSQESGRRRAWSTEPEILAHHFTEAGLGNQAIPHWKKAGELSIRRSANIEASVHFRKALDLLPELPPGESGRLLSQSTDPEAWTQTNLRLDLQLGLAVTLFATQGPASPESVATYEEANQLCELLGERQRLSPVIIGLWLSNLCRLNFSEALRLARQCRDIAQELADPTAELYAHIALGNTRYCMGKFFKASRDMENAERICQEVDEEAFMLRYGLDPVVQVLMFQTHVLWFLGKGDQARQKSRQLGEQAALKGHPFSRVVAAQAETIHQHHRRDVARVEECANRTIELASSENVMLFLGTGLMYRGWAMGMRGSHEQGLRAIEAGFYDHLKPASGYVAHSFYCLLAGEIYAISGQLDAGLEIIQTGIRFATDHEDLTYGVDLHRTHGDLLKISGELEAAENAYRTAINLAEGQSAIVAGLRARHALAKLRTDDSDNLEQMAHGLSRLEGGICEEERLAIESCWDS